MSDAHQIAAHVLPVPEAIRHLRNCLGQTQTQFSAVIGVAGATLARYETGTQVPKPSVLKLLVETAEQEGFAGLAEALQVGFRSGVERKIARSAAHDTIVICKPGTAVPLNGIAMLANETLLRARRCTCDPELPALSKALQLALNQLVKGS